MNNIFAIFASIDDLIGRIVKPLVIGLSLVVALGLVFGIVMRSGFKSPMLGLEEIVLLSVMWVYMLGAALASRERSHLRADFASVYIKSLRNRQLVQVLASSISLIVVIAFVIWSYSLFEWALLKQQATPVFKIPMYVSQSAMFIASVLILFYTLRDLLNDLSALHKSGSEVSQ